MVSNWSAFILVLPVLVLLIGFVIVALVAICRAAPSDIPTLFSTTCTLFARLGDNLHYRRRQLDGPGAAGMAGQNPEEIGGDSEVEQ